MNNYYNSAFTSEHVLEPNLSSNKTEESGLTIIIEDDKLIHDSLGGIP
jgi:hypothetical protein